MLKKNPWKTRDVAKKKKTQTIEMSLTAVERVGKALRALENVTSW